MTFGFLFTRLSTVLARQTSFTHSARNISSTTPLFINRTPCMYAEPLKKKKRIDPQILKIREDRKKRKLEKSIKQMQKFSMPLKPIDEMLVPLSIQDEKEKRTRPKPALSFEEQEDRIILMKSWCKYRLKEHLTDIQMIDRICYSQQRALDELRSESEELYEAALQVDSTLIPFHSKGPIVTPPIKDYDSPDGDYYDVSYKWE